MKALQKATAGIIAVLLFLLCLFPRTQVLAAETYTVTYRAGNVGTFDVDALAAYELNGIGMEVSENYVKVTLEKGTDTAALADVENVLMNHVDVQEGYLLLNSERWGYQTENLTSVTRNEEYVLDYGVLVDPVSYTILFVDSVSGEQIAPPVIVYGNAGDTVTRSPISIDGYTTADTETSITLVKNQTNTITFTYTGTQNAGTVTNTVINLIPTATATVTGNNAAGAAGAAAAEAQNADEDTTTIEDEDAAAADTPEETESDTTTIEDEDSARAAQSQGGNTVPVLAGILAVVVIAAIVLVVLTKRKKANVSTKDGNNKTD